MRKFRFLIALFGVIFLLALIATTARSNGNDPFHESLSSIRIADLRKHLSFLASDEVGGRYIFSPSIRVAARYLASELEAYGYRGAARDGSFFQKVPIAYQVVDETQSGVTLTVNGIKEDFKCESDYMLDPAYRMMDRVSGQLVFVGYGISSPANHHDDYAGLDVKGKFVIRVKGTPSDLKNVKIDPISRSWSALANSSLARVGAYGVLIIDSSLTASSRTNDPGK